MIERPVRKVVRDNKVAVLVSPNYGAGWSSWADDPEAAVFAPDVVAWVEAGKPNDVDIDKAFCHYGYLGGLFEVEIVWVPVGTRFAISEYDGFESLTIIGPDYGFVA